MSFLAKLIIGSSKAWIYGKELAYTSESSGCIIKTGTYIGDYYDNESDAQNADPDIGSDNQHDIFRGKTINLGITPQAVIVIPRITYNRRLDSGWRDYDSNMYPMLCTKSFSYGGIVVGDSLSSGGTVEISTTPSLSITTNGFIVNNPLLHVSPYSWYSGAPLANYKNVRYFYIAFIE